MGDFIKFDNLGGVDEAVGALVKDVGERVGGQRLSQKDLRKRRKQREKAVNRQRRGIVRIGLELHPGVKAWVEGLAEELSVPVSQVVNELLVLSADYAELVERIEDSREISKASRRYEYSLPYRDVPFNSKGRPLKK